jgi:hypothetical protein
VDHINNEQYRSLMSLLNLLGGFNKKFSFDVSRSTKCDLSTTRLIDGGYITIESEYGFYYCVERISLRVK